MAPGSSSRTECRTAGFSTITVLVSFILLGLLLSPLVGTIVTAQRSFVNSRERSTAVNAERYAHLMLSRYIRLAGASPTGMALTGVDPDPDGNGSFDSIRLRADFNPPDGDTADTGEDLHFFVRGDTMFVVRSTAAGEEPYLVGVEGLSFEYFDHDGYWLTDPGSIAGRAVAARVIIQSRGPGGRARTISGVVQLRNSGG